MKLFGREGTILILFQPPAVYRDAFQHPKFLQAPSKLTEFFRGCVIHNFSGLPVAGPYHPHKEEFLPTILFNITLCQFIFNNYIHL